jgi:hypothetical protein
MTAMRVISRFRRVNKPENGDPSIVEPIEVSSAAYLLSKRPTHAL